MGRLKRSPIWDDPRVKPPFGAAEVDWGHHCSQGLQGYYVFSEGAGGYARDFAISNDGNWANAGSNPGAWRVTDAGLVIDTGGTSYNRAIQSRHTYPSSVTTAPFTYAMRASFSVAIGGSFNHDLWGLHDGPGSGNVLPGLQRAVSSGVLRLSIYDGATRAALGTTALTVGPTFSLAGHWDGATIRVFVNGIQEGTQASGAPLIPAAAFLIVGSGNGNDADVGSAFYTSYAGFWTRALNSNEILELHAEPYAFLRPVIRRRYFVPAAGGLSIPVAAQSYRQRRVMV